VARHRPARGAARRGVLLRRRRSAAFFAWGYGGQFVYVVPTRDLVAVATTEWRALTETTPEALAASVLGVIVGDVVPAAR